MSRRKRWVPFAAAILLLASIGTAEAARITDRPAAVLQVPATLKQQAEAWRAEIARTPAFSAWRSATLHYAPLGPGTHGWLGTLHVNDKPVGYLVVYATPEGGYALGEYGVGPYPLFDAGRLQKALLRLELKQLAQATSPQAAALLAARADKQYTHPLVAAWKVTLPGGGELFFEGKSAEVLPIAKADLDKQAQVAAERSSDVLADADVRSVAHQHFNQAFDPFERFPWLSGQPLAATEQTLIDKLDAGRKLWYSAELYDRQLRVVWAITGYQLWDKQLYVAVHNYETDDLRLLPFQTLENLGYFYE